jgi:hypothetical protein
VCIASLGKLTCPAEYGESHVYLDPASIVDARRCKPCSCGGGQGACGGTLPMSDKACSAGQFDVKETLTSPGACVKLSSSYTKSVMYAEPPGLTGATCEPSGGGIDGDVGGTSLTVCCRRR